MCENFNAVGVITETIESYMTTITNQNKINSNLKISIPDIDFSLLCKNTHPKVIHILDKYWNIFTNNNNNLIYISILCNNPNGISLIEKHWDEIMHYNNNDQDIISHFSAKEIKKKKRFAIDWRCLCGNPNAIPILEQNWNLLMQSQNLTYNLTSLYSNPNAMKLIEKFNDVLFDLPKSPYRLPYRLFYLYSNPNAIDFITRNDKLIVNLTDYSVENSIYWNFLCSNPNAIHLIEPYLKTLDEHKLMNAYKLCSNPNALHLIDKYWDIIFTNNDTINKNENWTGLCKNTNPHVIYLIEKHWEEFKHITDLYVWHCFCENPNAIYLIEKYFEEIKYDINHDNIAANPSIFQDEYTNICKSYLREKITEELMQVVWHPKHIHRFEYLLGTNEDINIDTEHF